MLRQAVLLALSLALGAAAPVKQSPAVDMLGKLAALQGDWKGQFAWSGARSGSGDIAARYHAAKFKGEVFEELMMDGMPYMTSVYHLDGTGLRVTHSASRASRV
jgi:hypothetical protein